ncbi:MAG TPA: J domain-containing protein [Symbiobacteriaceae bacterium]|jgi:curved DNA-binding protein CbpA
MTIGGCPKTTLYAKLGVTESATSMEIRTAYRRLAQAHHPDHGGDPERMKSINAAYSVLGRPERRAEYDRALARHRAEAAARIQRAARACQRETSNAPRRNTSPFEPAGAWWDEAAYRTRETARQSPRPQPRQQQYQAPLRPSWEPHEPPSASRVAQVKRPGWRHTVADAIDQVGMWGYFGWVVVTWWEHSEVAWMGLLCWSCWWWYLWMRLSRAVRWSGLPATDRQG